MSHQLLPIGKSYVPLGACRIAGIGLVLDFQFGLSERKMLTEIKICLVAAKDNFKEIDA